MPSDFESYFELFAKAILVLKICKSAMCKLMSVVKLLPCDHLLFRFILILSTPASHNGKCLGVVASKRHELRRRLSSFSWPELDGLSNDFRGCKPISIACCKGFQSMHHTCLFCNYHGTEMGIGLQPDFLI